MSKRKIYPLLAIIVLAAVAGGAYKYLHKSPSKTVVFGAVIEKKEEASTLYYPTTLPDGYSLKNITSSKAEEDMKGVYILTIKSTTGRPDIFMTQQPIPEDFNFKTYHSGFSDKDEYNTPAGHATTGSIQNEKIHIVSIVGNTVWIILNTDSTVSLQELRSIAKDLTL